MGGYQLCYSPGLRDGVLSQGASATLPSPVYGKEFPNGRIVRTGNKFAREQVFRFNCNWGYLCVNRILEDQAKAVKFAVRVGLCLRESFGLTRRLRWTETFAILKRATPCGDSKNP